MITKKKQTVGMIVKKYFKGHYEDGLSVFDDLSEALAGTVLEGRDAACLKKMLGVFFLGQLVGLHTLNAIMSHFEIKSNGAQVKYKKLCGKTSNATFHKMFEYVFEKHLYDELGKMCLKDGSAWSRGPVTAVIDDSVFRQWLNGLDPLSAYEKCYGRFFSGQYGRVAPGFQAVTFGLAIKGVFYPLYFECAKKKDENALGGKETVSAAKRLIEKWGVFAAGFAKKGLVLPDICFSCDSGYNDLGLAEACAGHGLVYIGVPRKNSSFVIGGKKTNLSDWVAEVFLPAEEAGKKGFDDKERPFFIRFTAFYCSKEKNVTLLAFRLAGSDKVSVIFSYDKNIKSKTMRRNWFQRTYIEQFFKLLKNSLRIQNSTVSTKHCFDTKLLRFFFVALHVQKMVFYIRKHSKTSKKLGFGTIRMLLLNDTQIFTVLKESVKDLLHRNKQMISVNQ